MRSKREVESELAYLKKVLDNISDEKPQLKNLLSSEDAEKETSSKLFSLLKYMIDENRKTTMILNDLRQAMARLEKEFGEAYESEEPAQLEMARHDLPTREISLSEKDVQIVHLIQLAPDGMACADDIRQKMSYRGRNAASARLSRLCKLGVLARYQLGHKVFYKYDASKTTNTLIVTPPQ